MTGSSLAWLPARAAIWRKTAASTRRSNLWPTVVSFLRASNSQGELTAYPSSMDEPHYCRRAARSPLEAIACIGLLMNEMKEILFYNCTNEGAVAGAARFSMVGGDSVRYRKDSSASASTTGSVDPNVSVDNGARLSQTCGAAATANPNVLFSSSSNNVGIRTKNSIFLDRNQSGSVLVPPSNTPAAISSFHLFQVSFLV